MTTEPTEPTETISNKLARLRAESFALWQLAVDTCQDRKGDILLERQDSLAQDARTINVFWDVAMLTVRSGKPGNRSGAIAALIRAGMVTVDDRENEAIELLTIHQIDDYGVSGLTLTELYDLGRADDGLSREQLIAALTKAGGTIHPGEDQ